MRRRRVWDDWLHYLEFSPKFLIKLSHCLTPLHVLLDRCWIAFFGQRWRQPALMGLHIHESCIYALYIAKHTFSIASTNSSNLSLPVMELEITATVRALNI